MTPLLPARRRRRKLSHNSGKPQLRRGWRQIAIKGKLQMDMAPAVYAGDFVERFGIFEFGAPKSNVYDDI